MFHSNFPNCESFCFSRSICIYLKLTDFPLSSIFRMTLDAQGFFTVKPGMVLVVSAFAGMTARTCHHLAGSRIEDVFTNWMSKHTVLPVAFAAYIVNRCLRHGRMVRSVRRMAIVAGIGHLVFEIRRFMPFECRFMTCPTDMALLALEQAAVVAGMRCMTGNTAVRFVADQMIMR